MILHNASAPEGRGRLEFPQGAAPYSHTVERRRVPLGLDLPRYLSTNSTLILNNHTTDAETKVGVIPGKIPNHTLVSRATSGERQY